MESELIADLSSDRPITGEEDDALNRSSFAKRIATILTSVPQGDGLAIGIYGVWGDGKTSVLNMIYTYLTEDPNNIKCKFNPWRMKDEDAIFRGFFDDLTTAIGKSLLNKMAQQLNALLRFCRYLRFITIGFRYVSKTCKTIDDLIKMGESAASSNSGKIDKLRLRIIKRLAESKKRISVFIDDIDRLDKDEMFTLFRLIKACADFPNVSYVLAFDDVAVAKALGDRFGDGGEEAGRSFLEKIIQVPLKLPLAAREDLRSLCLEGVQQVLDATGIALSKEQEIAFASGFDHGVSVRLDTPRAGKRYANALMFALPMLKGEVNIVDLLLVEALRAFYPAIYDCLRDNYRVLFTDESSYGGNANTPPRSVKLLAPRIEELDETSQAAVKSLLGDLFPRLRGDFEGVIIGGIDSKTSSERKRICSPDYCMRYFSYSVPRFDMKASGISLMLKAAADGDEATVSAMLEQHFKKGEGGARRFIQQLREMENTCNPRAVRPLCVAISKNAGGFSKHRGFLGSGVPSQAGILISVLIARVENQKERVEIAKQVVASADPLWFGGECLNWMYVTDDSRDGAANALTEEGTCEVRAELVKRIKAKAAEGFPLFDVEIEQEIMLLFQWRRAEGHGPVQAHLLSLFERDANLIATFLQATAPQVWGASSVSPFVGDLDTNTLNSIKTLIDPDLLAELIRKHYPSDYENVKWRNHDDGPLGQRLCNQFMYVYQSENANR